MVRHGSRVGELANLRREVLADTRDREPLLGSEIGNALAGMRNCFRGVSICANLERVLALDLEKVADLGQHPGDSEIVHAKKVRSKSFRHAALRVSTFSPSVSTLK